MSSKNNELLSASMKRTSEWIFSLEIPSDVTVHVGDASFALHKLPLVSKCGYIRKLISASPDTDLHDIEIPDVPGGATSFELAAKFCYGVNFELSIENIAMLRCVAERLEMTEDYSVGNLVTRTEAYLNEVALQSLSTSVSVLRASEDLLPLAERVKLVSRCIDSVAYLASKEIHSSGLGGNVAGSVGGGGLLFPSSVSQQKPIEDWWAEDLTLLRIDFFQRVLIAMKARGFKQYALGPILMLYAQKSLRGLEVFGKGRKKIEPKQEHEKRVVLETIVSLLPREKNALSVSFLSMLLRSSIYLETTVACRLDLEKRMALQLGQAVLDDLLIPSFSFTGDTLFDVDTVMGIMTNYMELQLDVNHGGDGDHHEYVLSPPPSDLERVGKLMESYLAEIASDRNLTVPKFISLAELIPEQSRVAEDGIYRAIDIFLKAHPTMSETERKKVCSLMDCQKLSREACAHAAQNDRLPVQTVVQVLYYEQQRLRDVMINDNLNGAGDSSPAASILHPSSKMNLYTSNTTHQADRIRGPPVSDELVRLQRENEDLKMELARMKMKLKEIEKSTGSNFNIQSVASSPSGSHISVSADKPPLPRKSFITSVSKKFGRILKADGLMGPSAKARNKPSKDRRHSIS